MIKIPCLSIFFLLNTFFIYSQDNAEFCKCDSLAQSEAESKLVGELFTMNESIKGNQFYLDWSLGDVILSNGEIIHHKKLRYNGYLDELIWLPTTNYKMVQLEKESVKAFVLNPSNKMFKKVKMMEALTLDSTEVFMEILTEGKLSLYVYRRIKQVDSESVNKGQSSYMVDIIEPHFQYYLHLPNHELLSFNKTTRHSLLSAFPGQKSSIRKLLRQNHQFVTNETELIQAVQLIQKNLYKTE